MDSETQKKIANLELSVRVLSKILEEEGVLTQERIEETEKEVKQELAQQLLSGADTSDADYEPTQSSEVVEYSDGTVERNGEKFKE